MGFSDQVLIRLLLFYACDVRVANAFGDITIERDGVCCHNTNKKDGTSANRRGKIRRDARDGRSLIRKDFAVMIVSFRSECSDNHSTANAKAELKKDAESRQITKQRDFAVMALCFQSENHDDHTSGTIYAIPPPFRRIDFPAFSAIDMKRTSSYRVVCAILLTQRHLLLQLSPSRSSLPQPSSWRLLRKHCARTVPRLSVLITWNRGVTRKIETWSLGRLRP